MADGGVDWAASAAERADLQRMVDRIQKVQPNYTDSSMSVEQSVKNILAIIESLGPKDTASYRNAALV